MEDDPPLPLLSNSYQPVPVSDQPSTTIDSTTHIPKRTRRRSYKRGIMGCVDPSSQLSGPQVDDTMQDAGEQDDYQVNATTPVRQQARPSTPTSTSTTAPQPHTKRKLSIPTLDATQNLNANSGNASPPPSATDSQDTLPDDDTGNSQDFGPLLNS